jgi:hypothetical protein
MAAFKYMSEDSFAAASFGVVATPKIVLMSLNKMILHIKYPTSSYQHFNKCFQSIKPSRVNVRGRRSEIVSKGCSASALRARSSRARFRKIATNTAAMITITKERDTTIAMRALELLLLD